LLPLKKFIHISILKLRILNNSRPPHRRPYRHFPLQSYLSTIFISTSLPVDHTDYLPVFPTLDALQRIFSIHLLSTGFFIHQLTRSMEFAFLHKKYCPYLGITSGIPLNSSTSISISYTACIVSGVIISLPPAA